MAYYIMSDTAELTKTHKTAKEAVEDFCRPPWEGASEKEITWKSDIKFIYMGRMHEIVETNIPVGVLPKEYRKGYQSEIQKKQEKQRGSRIFKGLYGFEEGEEGYKYD